MDHIDWFAYAEPFLHPRVESHLIAVYVPLMCCWIQFAGILLKIFVSVFTRDIGL